MYFSNYEIDILGIFWNFGFLFSFFFFLIRNYTFCTISFLVWKRDLNTGIIAAGSNDVYPMKLMRVQLLSTQETGPYVPRFSWISKAHSPTASPCHPPSPSSEQPLGTCQPCLLTLIIDYETSMIRNLTRNLQINWLINFTDAHCLGEHVARITQTFTPFKGTSC